jgi:hypothetical protein
VLTPRQALAYEPELNPDLKLAVQVPDAAFDAWRLPLHFLATAECMARNCIIHGSDWYSPQRWLSDRLRVLIMLLAAKETSWAISW